MSSTQIAELKTRGKEKQELPVQASSAPPSVHLLMWLVCIVIFLSSCSITEVSGFSSSSVDSTPILSAPSLEYIDASPPLIFNMAAHSDNNTSVQTDAQSDSLEETISNIKLQAHSVTDDKLESNIDEIPYDYDTTTKKKESKKEQRRKSRSIPELQMSDREKKRRDEMDRSGDQLILTLNTEQSNEEHLNLMRYLREMQKQEIVIEL